MKKVFMFLAVIGLMAISANIASAQEQAAKDTAATEQVAPAASNDASSLTPATAEVPLNQAI